jgi:predicted lysophospholipase L1 biosynthesis ABC-type transport system permease subunit
MVWLHFLAEVFNVLFRKERVERELDEELRFHLEQEIEKNVRAGMGTHPPAGFADVLRQTVWGVDPEQPVPWVRTLDDMRATSISRERLNLLLVGAFGPTALVLALMGVYGLVAYSFSARTQEIGLRLALGAQPTRVLAQFIGQGLRVSVLGVAIRLVLSFLTARGMESVLFGITARDSLSFTVVPGLLLFAALLASFLPALRASRLDPLEALRYE